MGSKQVGRYTFATIQSIYNDPEFFSHFKLVVIDEAHGLNPKSMTGMFMKFLKKIGNPKVIGFTATPYRLDTMYVDWGTADARCVTTIKLINRMKGFFWSRILVNVTMEFLIEQGYLIAPTYVDASLFEQSEIPLNKSRSEFDLDLFDRMLETKMERLQRVINYAEPISKSVLVFCTSVSQAKRLCDTTPGSAYVSGKTPTKERNQIIEDFKNHKIKTVFNVGVLTTGFDHPALDCIILMRPTRSIMLYVQMVGRGVRTCEGKTTCRVFDLTSNVKNLGRVETIKIHKENGQPWDLISETGSWHAKELYSFGVNKWVDVQKLPPLKEGELPF
jgi:DNA repair protein RadD